MATIAWSLLALSCLAGLIQLVDAYTNINDQRRDFAMKPNLNVMPDIRWAHQCMMEDERFQGFHLTDIHIEHGKNQNYQFPLSRDSSDGLGVTMKYRPTRAQDGSTRTTENASLYFLWPGRFRPYVYSYSSHRYEDEVVPIDIDRDLRLGVSDAAEVVYKNFGRRLPMPTKDPPLWTTLIIRHEPLGENLPFIYQPSICVYIFYRSNSLRPPKETGYITLPVEDDKVRADLIHTGNHPIMRRPKWLDRKIRLATGLLRS